MDALTCPRCLGPLDDELLEEPEEMRGPSYVDENDTLVCMDCRLDEAARMAAKARNIPLEEWPILDGPHDYILTFELDPDKR
ncbi:Trm112 family protein [Microbacterium imperiale]|uniref:Uncharacterized protein n=1 Tax=Microbacterium imperiale TaxID=33884 RepID=A0A9W6HFC3_9MICO|nr:Trm112 family protein [Microbacterium imperiale]MBP2419670.1 hypothetical protein [Microbacterium imperiale]MDS0198464.1 hypothetical protein [Microbacterium imperiale]BFE40011.1 hypothetical protein GCM10017544_09670 [Microbacterium imperiale]GLJ79014.1 hypothetical protein GCM10017586_06960 [Microbacterium imperiale]